MPNEAERIGDIAAAHAGVAAMRPDVELSFRMASLRGLRALPGQTPEEIEDVDGQIAEVQRLRDLQKEGEEITVDDLFVQVKALELAHFSMAVTVDTLCQALACAFGENRASDLRQVAADVLAAPPESSCTEPEAVEHGRTVAIGVLVDMADAIDRGHATVSKMVAGPERTQ